MTRPPRRLLPAWIRAAIPTAASVWLLAGLLFALPSLAHAQPGITPAEARAIAREATIYGFPLVDHYRIQHAYFVDRGNPEYKGPWNTLINTPRVFTPDDKAIQTPNSDTPYSFVGLDLRAEPIVITLPRVDKDRYYSVQLIDAYTHNFAYLGSRTTGNEGANFMIVGPGWKGVPPRGIRRVFFSETAFAFALIRTQLFDAADLDKVKEVQAGYRVRTVSQFVGGQAPAAAPAVDFIAPPSAEQLRTSADFFDVLNFVLQFQPPHPSEQALLARLAPLGIGPGRSFAPVKDSPTLRRAVEEGMADAWQEFGAFKAKQIDTGKLTSADLFGTRAFLRNDSMRRMSGAALGIYGNSREEAIYPAYFTDAAGEKLDGANRRYTLRFAPGQLPPVDAFWSLTLYELPSSLLVANPINRYLINSPMLPNLKRDADGGITLLIQNEHPGSALESNWLPAPEGPFWLALRLYRPRSAALNGQWKLPQLKPVATEAVSAETYIRAETDRNFRNLQKLAGGVNRLAHVRTPTPLDRQTVVRMNKDTLYSSAIVDTEGGATITLPEMPSGRYMSALLIDNDHYAPKVIYTAGTHALPTDTRHLAVIVRVQLLKPDDPADVAAANRLQDQVVISAKSAEPLPPMKWEAASLKRLTEQYEKDAARQGTFKGLMGPRGSVDEKYRHLAAAAGWGLLPEADATYLSYTHASESRACQVATFRVPEHNAFWSITVYGNDGTMKSANAVLNASNVRLNNDGSFTARFGPREVCGDAANRLDVSEGWNYTMRIYRPGASVLSGAYTLPRVTTGR
jgi:hypothetical protein